MSIISALPYTLQNDNPADASQVMADLNQIRNDVNNNAGVGSVTSIIAGTGLSGGTITNSGTVSISNKTPNTLAGFNNSGVFSDVTIGANLTLSGGVLNASGGGGGATPIVLTSITSATTFTLPANSIPKSIAVRCTSGALASGAIYPSISNTDNPYPGLFANTTSYFGGVDGMASGSGFITNILSNISGGGTQFQAVLSNSPSTWTFDISDLATPGNGFNGATVDAIIEYVTF